MSGQLDKVIGYALRRLPVMSSVYAERDAAHARLRDMESSRNLLDGQLAQLKELNVASMREFDLVAIDDTTEADIFICSYPRSGVTWFQNLLAGLIHGVDPRMAHDSVIQELVPDIHQRKFFKRYGKLTCFKSHNLPEQKYRRVINLVRDGRDVMVSYYHFTQALNASGMDMLRFIKDHPIWPSPWHDHVEAWLSNPYGAEILLLRYEDLRADTTRELRRVADFLGLDRDEALLEHISGRSSFSNAQKKEMELGWDSKVWPRDKKFVRRGEVGSFKDEMPPESLQALMELAGPTLARLGYL